MRIISGSHRGRIINVPKTFKHRPTTDVAKEGLFNILANNIDFEDINVLDLFSGTGSISYEFASRGSKQIVAVDNNYRNVEFIRKCASDFRLDEISPVKSDVFRFIESTSKKFDLVFVDPPYEMKDFDLIPNRIFSSSVLASDGLFILEHSSKYSFNKCDGFESVRTYGSVNFSFFRNKSI